MFSDIHVGSSGRFPSPNPWEILSNLGSLTVVSGISCILKSLIFGTAKERKTVDPVGLHNTSV